MISVLSLMQKGQSRLMCQRERAENNPHTYTCASREKNKRMEICTLSRKLISQQKEMTVVTSLTIQVIKKSEIIISQSRRMNSS